MKLNRFLDVTVPSTDHTPVPIFFIAAERSASGFSWFGAADFCDVLARSTDELANRSNAAKTHIHIALTAVSYMRQILVEAIVYSFDGTFFFEMI